MEAPGTPKASVASGPPEIIRYRNKQPRVTNKNRGMYPPSKNLINYTPPLHTTTMLLNGLSRKNRKLTYNYEQVAQRNRNAAHASWNNYLKRTAVTTNNKGNNGSRNNNGSNNNRSRNNNRNNNGNRSSNRNNNGTRKKAKISSNQ